MADHHTNAQVLPFFFVMFGLFNGVVRPYATLSVFWRYWMYYVNPSTYWIGGILSATLAGQPVECAPGETALFDVPPPSEAGGANRTCAAYAGAFAETAGGYLLNPDALSGCEYCPYRSGDDFLRTLNITPDEKWRGEFPCPSIHPPIYPSTLFHSVHFPFSLAKNE